MEKKLEKKVTLDGNQMNAIKGGTETVLSDIDLLNPADEDGINATDRKKLGCFLTYKLYSCGNYEVSCPGSFSFDKECKQQVMTCSQDFTVTPF